MGIKKSLWGRHHQQDVFLVTISNNNLELTLTNLGATLVSLFVKDAGGTKINLVLGYKTLNEYCNDPFYMGATVGRFANRIANARFWLNHTTYQLAANDGNTGNHLHGGRMGFNKKVFEIQETEIPNAICFYYKSPAGEEGYPGNLELTVTYQLTESDGVCIGYEATTDAATPASFTNHSYFNLSGTAQEVTGTHQLFINSTSVAEAGIDYIPTGTLKPVKDTELDFSAGGAVAQGINECFSIAHTAQGNPCAALYHTPSGRGLTVQSTLPALMVYTGDYLTKPFLKNEGICLETQYFPDSPNQPNFPSAILQLGAVYQHQTTYQFYPHFNPNVFLK